MASLQLQINASIFNVVAMDWSSMDLRPPFLFRSFHPTELSVNLSDIIDDTATVVVQGKGGLKTSIFETLSRSRK